MIEALLITVWQEANRAWQHRLSEAPGGPKTAAPAPAAASASTSSEDKVPKQLPSGVWNDGIRRYNAVEIQHIARRFPERELVGAQSVLARMHHEHSKTKLYTPTYLGEILQARSFTSTGDPNPLAKPKADQRSTLVIEGDKLVQEPEKLWSPKSVLSVIDAIRSIQWAWILLDFGRS